MLFIISRKVRNLLQNGYLCSRNQIIITYIINMKTWKKCLPDILAVLLFAVLSLAYFFPADIEGRILYRHDSSAGRGLGHEQAEYYQRTGERTRWTNSTFSGMPTYQIAPSYESDNVLKVVEKAFHLWLPENVWYVFVYLLGFYILMRAFDFRQALAVLGSIIWAFSSYFFIIIAAGHIWKVIALGYLPPLIAGIVLAYRGRYLWALVLTAVFGALEIGANHVQMTYYYLFIMLFIALAYLIDAIRKKTLPAFLKGTAVCIVGAALAVCINLPNLYHTWQYSKESMRGKSELVKPNSANQTDSGLERDYITQWSYGIDETWTLLVPNAKGGSHQIKLGDNKNAMKKSDAQYAEVVRQWYQYWGDQPFTAGPVYVGAFVLMLFIFGIFVVKGPMKWALLAATVLSVLLSWGRNFMPFTNFFIDYIPMYSKFRTVSSILVIAEFTIPVLAMLALKRIIDEPELLKRKLKIFYLSFALTGGIALLFAIMPGALFDFTSQSDAAQLSRYVPEQYLAPILESISNVRKAIFTADCWRSFVIVTIGALVLLFYKAGKLKTTPMVAILTVLCLADMWQVNKRYLNDDMFVGKSVREAPVQQTATEEQILQDKSLNYRVLNFASDTFNENETSYYLKSIGGYHPAKLRRYQEMIEKYISPEMRLTMPAIAEAGGDMTLINGDSIFPVLNMLNAKYFIVPLQSGQTVPIRNPYVHGNAWFVDKVNYADNANGELDMVGQLDLRHEAVADKRFSDVLGNSAVQDSTSIVTITSCDANKLTYDVSSSKGGVIVFSEVYYPGWTATVDGEEAEVGRVNYILRAIQVKPGDHKVELTFFPKTVTTTETVAYVAYAVLLLIFLAIAGMRWKEMKKNKAVRDTEEHPQA